MSLETETKQCRETLDEQNTAQVTPDKPNPKQKAISDKPNVSSFNVIREWINGNEHVSARCDEGFILQYLTISEFDIARTKERITNYNDCRRLMPTWFDRRDESVAKGMFCDQMVFYNTKYQPDSEMSLCVVLLGNLDFCKYSLEQYNNIGIATGEAVFDDVRYQLIGTDLLMDFENISISIFYSITHSYLWRMLNFWQKAMPVKINKLHMINAPMVYSALLSAGEYLFSNTFGDKLINHGSDLKSLQDAVPVKYLPFEYGGTAGPARKFASICNTIDKKLPSVQSQIHL